ncbi:C1 family peptidase [Spirosoma gilvum]
MKAVRWFIGLIFISLAFPAAAQTDINPGMLLDDDAYERLPYQEIITKAKLPVQVSYEAFCPSIRAQGDYSTCVGFACGYYFRTIIEAKRRRITTKRMIDQLAFSPAYLYEKAKLTNDYACMEGVFLSKAFEVLKGIGVVPATKFPYPACSQETRLVDDLASQFRISSYDRVFRVGDEGTKKIANLKKALAERSPVVVGMVLPSSFYFSGPLWTPVRTDDPQDKRLKGHALCIIGYDDKRNGGSFRIINSFGDAWADQGFCWVRYQDLARFARYGYSIGQP